MITWALIGPAVIALVCLLCWCRASGQVRIAGSQRPGLPESGQGWAIYEYAT
jgi:hypothetical protein